MSNVKPPAISIERRVSIFDVMPPYRFTEKHYRRYLEELKRPELRFIEDVTVSGEFIYGNKNNRVTKNIRIEVDSRFVTDNDVRQTMEELFKICKHEQH